MKRSIRHVTVATLATLMAAAAFAELPAKPAVPSEDPLYRRIEALDKAVFGAFNRCDLEKLASYFAPELEFYHDKGGVTWGRDQFISDVKRNVCGKFRRELVASTLEVWPIGEWGAGLLRHPQVLPVHRHALRRHRQVCAHLAKQGGRLAHHARHQLRPSRRAELITPLPAALSNQDASDKDACQTQAARSPAPCDDTVDRTPCHVRVASSAPAHAPQSFSKTQPVRR